MFFDGHFIRPVLSNLIQSDPRSEWDGDSGIFLDLGRGHEERLKVYEKFGDRDGNVDGD